MESSNPKPRSKSNVLHIGGIAVEFPYKPYGSQLAYMGRVISTLDRAQRDGHCNALLESPTGTGKSLSLLCSALAWQQNCASKALYGNLSHSKPDPEALNDPIGHGGGFVPELEPSGNTAQAPATTNDKKKKKKTSPTIFYASRTHSQITQVIREYRKTAYRVPMAVLASRKHYCTNSLIRGEDNIDEKCKLLLKNREAREVGCQEFGNVNKVRAHPSLQKGGCHEAHDIEDLLKVGQIVKGCSYFAARDMADVAQIVFCPYSYIINPLIRKAMEVDIQGGIVIFDEAHNIEDIARDAGSIDVEEDVLSQLQMELANLRQDDSLTYEPLHEMIEGILSWMRRRKCTLEKHGFQNYVSCWTGDKALHELQEANLSRQCFPILQECAKKAIQAASDAELEIAHLSGMAVNTLEGLFSSLNYFFSGNGLHILDYQLALQKYIKNGAGNPVGDWTYTLRLSCLNPAVVFKEIADLSLSVILTSGTLSPMSSFQSELGVRFETCLEAPHVINVDSQLWAAAISSGPGNYPLNASYKTAESYDFQDAIGKSLEEICKVVPGGCLVFFPSYKLMEKLCNRWSETGLWSRLNAEKPIFVEPRGSQEDFEPVLKGYYDAIHRGIKPMTGRKRRGKKLDPTNCDAECKEKIKKGAAFLAVCRGKVSEGIDFSDENARVVIIVGIPFPNIYDLQVAQKKKFNDTYKSSKNLLSGNEWYCQQAFRALNQAAGRCIRHRFDYGAVIFLDERFRQERNLTYISKWLRRSIRHYDSFDQSLEGLKSFFKDVKVENTGNLIHPIDIEVVDNKDQRKLFTNRKNLKVSKANECSNKLVSNGHIPAEMGEKLYRTPIIGTNYNCFPLKTESGAQTSRQTTKKDRISCIEYIDLESHMEDDSRFSLPELMNSSPNGPQLSVVKETPSQSGSFPVPITLADDDPDLAIVKETPTRDYNDLAVSPEISEDEYSTSTIIQTEVPEQLSYKLSSPSSMFARESIHSLVSPKIDAGADTIHYIPQAESSFNVSVNSRTQKRRKSLGSPLIKHLKQHLFDSPDPKTPIDVGFMESSIITTDASYRVISGHETTCSGSGPKENNIHRSHAMDICETSSAAYGSTINKTLQLICSLCRHPLGLAENNYHVTCSLTFLSKVHLISLWKEKFDTSTGSPSSVSIIVCDISSVDQQFWGRAYEGARGQGIWSKDDGCVFNTIFCPFCSDTKNCIGLHVVAADSSNVQFLNKLLFYSDRLEAKDIKVRENKDISPLCTGKSALQDSIEKFAYAPQQQNAGGWRTTKSKMQLPKKG